MQRTVVLLDKLMFSNIVLFSKHTATAVSNVHCFINSLYKNSLFCLAVLHVTKKNLLKSFTTTVCFVTQTLDIFQTQHQLFAIPYSCAQR